MTFVTALANPEPRLMQSVLHTELDACREIKLSSVIINLPIGKLSAAAAALRK